MIDGKPGFGHEITRALLWGWDYVAGNSHWRQLRVNTDGRLEVVALADPAGGAMGPLAAGENHIGQLGGESNVISQTPTITNGAYHAKDAVGGLLTFAGAGRVAGGSGVIMGVTIIDHANQAAELVLVLYDRLFTATADNAAFDPSDADNLNCIGHIKIVAADYQAFNDNCVATKSGIGLPFQLPAGGQAIFGQLMCTGTPTYAATSDLTVKLRLLQD